MAANGSGGMHDALLDNGFAGTDDLVSDWYIYETMEPAMPQDE